MRPREPGHQQIDVVCRGLPEEGICHMIKVHVRRDRIVFGKEAGPKVFHHLLGGQTFRRGNLFHLVPREVLGREFRDGGLDDGQDRDVGRVREKSFAQKTAGPFGNVWTYRPRTAHGKAPSTAA